MSDPSLHLRRGHGQPSLLSTDYHNDSPTAKQRRKLWLFWRRQLKAVGIVLTLGFLTLWVLHSLQVMEERIVEDTLQHESVLAASRVHPIETLIANAETEWNNKVERQSKTLREAVDEYQRRYRRPPPAGFDKWWAYAMKNNVGLVDEYDTIDDSIRPFIALTPKNWNRRSEKAQRLKDVFLIRIKAGQISTETRSNIGGAQARLDSQLALLRPVAEWLPDTVSVWSPHDTGRILIHQSERQELLHSPPELHDNLDEEDGEGFRSACHYRVDKQTKRFIDDVVKSLDICAHPEQLDLHGAFASNKRPQISAIVPLFSISKTGLHSDILAIPYQHIINQPYVPWSDRTKKLLWRGGATGAHYDKEVDWKRFERFRLVDLEKQPPRRVMTPSGDEVEMTGKEAVERYLDASFVGGPIQCDQKDGTCDEMAKSYTFAPRMPHQELVRSRYLLDVNGNAWSARFPGLLSTGAMVVQSTAMREWYQDRIQPWVHYVPLSISHDEIFDIMAFFQGTDSHPGHDAMAERIGTRGMEWKKRYWRKEDEVAYTFRLMLEYARLGRFKAGSYVYDSAHEV